MHRAHQTLPPPPPKALAETTIHAHGALREVVTACERLAAGDVASADAAFKRLMLAAGDARAALQPALVAKALPPELKDWDHA